MNDNNKTRDQIAKAIVLEPKIETVTLPAKVEVKITPGVKTEDKSEEHNLPF